MSRPLDRLVPREDLGIYTGGLDYSTIYRRIKSGTFPAPVQIGPRRIAWRESDLIAWQESLQVGVRSATTAATKKMQLLKKTA